MPEFRELNLTETAHGMRSQKVSCEKLVRSCLERLLVQDKQLKAWTEVHQEQALKTARQLDEEKKANPQRSPLHGITVGVQDVIDVAGMATRAGSNAYPSRVVSTDAEIVSRMRKNGAIILGKTATSPFAFTDPSPTLNPWHLEYTPGDSCSGSAVAVADRHCQIALGTETSGSIISTAAYNGVVGFKPGHASLPSKGIIPLSWQLDQLGTLSRSVEDAWLFWETIRPQNTPKALLDDKLPRLVPQLPQRIWRLDELVPNCNQDVRTMLDNFCNLLSKKGSLFVQRKLPPAIKELPRLHHTILAAEVATIHKYNKHHSVFPYPPNINSLIEEGLKITAADYLAATRDRQSIQALFDSLMDRVEIAILPATPAPAPKNLNSVGTSIAALPFSFLGLPSLSLPISREQKNGLPLALQLVAPRFQEETLLTRAMNCENILPFEYHP